MSQTVNNVTYNYNGQLGGTTAAGTQWSFTLLAQAAAPPDSTEFTEATSWTFLDALATALSSVGWPVTAADISVQKAVLNDEFSNGDAATRTYA